MAQAVCFHSSIPRELSHFLSSFVLCMVRSSLCFGVFCFKPFISLLELHMEECHGTVFLRLFSVKDIPY